MPDQVLDIAEVARQSGLAPSTLRYYEEKGLIASVGRHGLRRLFAASVLDRLALIILGRNAGFSLAQIGRMLATTTTGIDREQLAARADEIDETIQRLSAIRDGLRHAVTCPASNHWACPTFQQLIRVALQDQRRQSKRKNRES